MSDTLSKLVTDEACHLLDQSMNKIRNCVDQLDEKQVWFRPADDLNSIGNLLLHLAGNLKQWAISGIGESPDNREREKEFTQREVIAPNQLLEQLQNVVDAAKKQFDSLSPATLEETRVIQGFETTVYAAMSHTTTHFVGHTHQIIYLTRLQLGENYRFEWTPESGSFKNVPI